MGVMIRNRVVDEKQKEKKGQHDSNYIFLPLNLSNEGVKTYIVSGKKSKGK